MYKLELTIEELRVIAQSLHEIPYKIAAPILQKIDFQVQPQMKGEQAQPAEPNDAAN